MKLNKRMKPPFAYWGGKHYALSRIAYYLPQPGPRFETLVSPFCGGGSLELNAALNGYRVRAADMFEPVITFWKVLTGDPQIVYYMQDIIKETDPQTKRDWLAMREAYWSERDIATRAAYFYNINNHSFSGLTFQDNSYCAPSRHALAATHLIKYNQALRGRINFALADYTETLRRNHAPRRSVIYADPPYADLHEKRYGKKRGGTFNHARLKSFLDRHEYWLLSYGDTAPIRELYAGYHMVRPRYKWTSGRHEKTGGKLKPAEDLLIFSDALADMIPSIAPARL